MSEHFHPQKAPRLYFLDIIRGVAVFLMVIAHAIDFYHDGSVHYLRGLVNFSNTLVFTTFLFISGTVAFLAYLNRDGKWLSVHRRLIYRLLLFVLSYFILALFSLSDKLLSASLIDRWKIIFKIVTFQLVPSYTEFLIPLFVFSLLLIFCRGFFQKLASNWRLALIVSVSFYIVGALLYRLPLPDSISPWKALLVGDGSMTRFPILQYFPIYIAGLQWGRWLATHPSPLNLRKTCIKLAGLALLSLILISIVYSAFGSAVLLRWPPSLPFLLAGLLFVFVLSFLISRLNELRPHAFFRDSLLLLGQNALAIYWTHIFLLKLYRLSDGVAVSSPLIVIGLFIILIITSLALATFIPFNFAFHLTFIREGGLRYFEPYSKEIAPPIYELVQDLNHRPRLLHRTGFFIIAAFIFLLTLSFLGLPKLGTSAEPPPPPPWWNRDFSYYRPILIKNDQSFTALQANSPVSLLIDHRQMVQEKKSLTSGDDVRVVYYNGFRFKEVERWAKSGWNSNQTTINFSLTKSIGGGQTSNDYYLYYGNNISDPYKSRLNSSTSATQVTTTVGQESASPLLGEVSRLWTLKSDGFTKPEPLSYSLRINSKNEFKDPIVNYEIVGTTLRGVMQPVTADTWETTIDINSLPAGTYRIRAHMQDNGVTSISQNTGLRISYPLYVTWTQDWEGYDEPNTYLNAIAQIARQHHNIPLTHFFNPRIYTAPDIPDARKNFLTNWVTNRRDTAGDEIALHLHMFPDFVSAAGVTPKSGPQWSFNKDGYDIMTTNYTYEEMLKLLTKSKQLFEQNNLGTPTIYRAGGWYANGETLRALQDSGFLVDSSGRTTYKFGTRQVPGFWQLSPTAKPYFPSTTNQNSSAPPPNLTLLEIPNNGADSYAFSAKDMISRFKANFSGLPLSEKQQVTFLSHPHWFSKTEQQRVNEIFNYVDDYLYSLDQGPVRYVTTGQVYQAWTQGN